MNDKENESRGNSQKNNIKVTNNISFSLHLGDSLNILTLIVGLFFIKTISKQNKWKRKLLNENKGNI